MPHASSNGSRRVPRHGTLRDDSPPGHFQHLEHVPCTAVLRQRRASHTRQSAASVPQSTTAAHAARAARFAASAVPAALTQTRATSYATSHAASGVAKGSSPLVRRGMLQHAARQHVAQRHASAGLQRRHRFCVRWAQLLAPPLVRSRGDRTVYRQSSHRAALLASRRGFARAARWNRYGAAHGCVLATRVATTSIHASATSFTTLVSTTIRRVALLRHSARQHVAQRHTSAWLQRRHRFYVRRTPVLAPHRVRCRGDRGV